MPSGLEIRAQIDTENVKGLLLINGGAAVALIAFLPAVLGKPQFDSLTRAVLIALLMFQLGLLSAVVHNRLRRICSLTYEAAWTSSPSQHPVPCDLFGYTLKEPCICLRSILFMWASVGLFFAGGLLVFLGGMAVT